MKAQPDVHDFTAGGRYDVANDSNKRKLFFDTLFDPLLTISAKYKDVIYAWEVMNEPIWVTKSLLGPVKGGFVTDATLTTFLDEAIKLIAKHGLPSTVGHRYFPDLQKYPTGTVKQFHYYPRALNSDPDPLPTQPDAFMGEFGTTHPGQSVHGLFSVDPSGPWPGLFGLDKDPDEIVQRRLQVLEAMKYSLGLVWPDLSDPVADSSGLKLSKNKLEQIRKFHSGYRTA